MKCWKCGKEIPDGASVCTYCSASMNRKAPATPAGKAMRQIYDRFGSGRVFDKKSILSIALGDMLEDSKKIRSQIDMVMSASVGGVYLNQLQNVGKPDSAFCDKIKKLMTDEAGLSDKVAAELMGYFDEMIGWAAAEQPAAPSGGAAAQSRPAPQNEIPRPEPDKKTPPPTPIDGTAVEYFAAAYFGNSASLAAALLARGNKAAPKPNPNPKPLRAAKLEYKYAFGVLKLHWGEKLKEFTIKIQGDLVASGSGNSIRIPIELGYSAYIKLEGVGYDGVDVWGCEVYSDPSKLKRR